MIKKFRLRVTKEQALLFDLRPIEDSEFEKGRNKAVRYLTAEQIVIAKNMNKQPLQRSFVNTQNKYDKKGDIVSSVEKLQSEPIEIPENFEIVKISTSKTTGQQWIQYKEKAEEIKDFDFSEILNKYIKDVEVFKFDKVAPIKDADFQSLTITDVHVGMDTDAENKSMYATEWNAEALFLAAEHIIYNTLLRRNSSTLIVDELGDLLDGYNGQTTRGGHKLPQNMTNEEAFDNALKFKMMLVYGLAPYYDDIVFNNICNDNHAGSFGYFVNSAFKQLVELKFEHIKVTNYLKFINHYYVGRICFVITHGKDDSTLKFGFKPHIDTKAIEKIDQYCKHNKIYNNSDLVIFKKGDSHQCLFDMASSDDFYYYNYPALSPSSQWVQNNFKKGRRGYVISSFKDLNITNSIIFI